MIGCARSLAQPFPIFQENLTCFGSDSNLSTVEKVRQVHHRSTRIHSMPLNEVLDPVHPEVMNRGGRVVAKLLARQSDCTNLLLDIEAFEEPTGAFVSIFQVLQVEHDMNGTRFFKMNQFPYFLSRELSESDRITPKSINL